MTIFRSISPAWLAVALACTFVAGCAESPLYGLWYRKQWLDDEKYGDTLHTRLGELATMRKEAQRMDAQQQTELAQRLAYAVAEDPSGIYRAEAVRTLGALSVPLAAEGLQQAISDPEPAVRAAACEAWGRRGDAQSLQVLAQVVRADADKDVRMAATRELGKFQDPAAIQALAVALDDSDPALQFRAVESLRLASGEDFGNSIPAWRQYVRGEPVDREEAPSMVSQLRSLF